MTDQLRETILDIAIIGGGLSGLSLAKALLDKGADFAVFEARDRFGGRILSQADDTGFRYDLGPSWIWPSLQPRLTDFVAEHGIAVYAQWCHGLSLYQSEREEMPQAYMDQGTYASARRIQGGAYRLIEVLLQSLPRSVLYPIHAVRTLLDKGDYIELGFALESGWQTVLAKQVVITIPPRLLNYSVEFTPSLDTRLHEVMQATPTWMAGHAKALIRYPRAFWRDAGFSGSALARYPGVMLAEIFDASADDGSHAALSGFLAPPAGLRRRYRHEMDALILEQLEWLFGKEATQPQTIRIMDWCGEQYTATTADEDIPSGHPQYGHPWLQLDHWNDKLFFSGTETAEEYGGYLEGALEASERVLKSLSISMG